MRRSMPAAWLAALPILLLLSCGSLQRIAIAQACVPVESVAAQLRLDLPDADVRRVSGMEAGRIEAGISQLMGQRVPAGGDFIIAQRAGDPLAYVVRFADGCATHHGRFPTRLVRAWLEGSPA